MEICETGLQQIYDAFDDRPRTEEEFRDLESELAARKGTIRYENG